jgi:chemotaxis protein histidine kinase CheA
LDTKVTEYTELFLSEGEEILASLNNTLIELEKDPSSPALIDEVFRLSHTLKSMAQSMGYDRITVLTHSMENALAAIRQGSLTANKETVNLLFRAIDVLSQLVDEVKDRRPVTAEVNPLLEEFERLASLSRSADGKTHPDSAGTDAGGAHLRRRNGPSGPPPPIGDIRILRVPVTRFDTILDTAGELAIGTSRLMQVSGKLEDSQLKSAVSRVSGLAGLLQDQIMQIRLIPLAYLFTPYPRMVRDIAARGRTSAWTAGYRMR